MNHDHEHWVDERLQSLEGPNGWNPSIADGLTNLHERRIANRRRTTAGTWVLVAVVVAGIAAVSIPTIRLFEETPQSAPGAGAMTATRPVEVPVVARTGVFDNQLFDGSLIPQGERQPAIDFTLADHTGAGVTLSQYRDRVVLLNFWATWCRPCVTEIPWLIELQQEYEDVGLSTLGVSMDEGGWNVIRPFVADLGVNYPILLADDGLPSPYRDISGLPVTAVVDRQGMIAAVHPFMVDKDHIEEQVNRLLEH